MRLNMELPVSNRTEPLLTYLTLVWFLLAMYPHMAGQIILLIEPFSTSFVFTDEEFYTEMSSHVNRQRASLFEFTVAVFT